MRSFFLDFDDLHPEKAFGFEEDLFYFFKLKEEFPKLKATFYLTPNWVYKSQSKIRKGLSKFLGFHKANQWKGEPFRLDKHLDWIDWVNECISNNLFEVGVHGFYHLGLKHPFPDEFTFLNEKQTEERINSSLDLFEKVGLNYKKVFHPPGWGWNKYLEDVLKSNGFKVVSIKGETRKLKNLKINADVKKTSYEQIKNVEKYVVFHGYVENYCYDEKTGNGIDEKTYLNLKQVLSNEKFKFKYHSEF